MSVVPSPARPLALVAEDEPLIMMETVDLLEERGFDVLEAYRADKALALLEENPKVVLLVTDVQMPGPMNGFGLAREAHRRYPKLSIVVCSGQVQPGANELPGAALFIGKPLSAKVLRETLQQLDQLPSHQLR